MKLKIFFLWALFYVGGAIADIVGDDAYYTIESGDVRTVDIASVSQVAVGSPDIVNYKVLDNGQLLIIAQKAGITTLQVWRNDGRVSRLHFEVRESGTYQRIREVREMTKGIHGLAVSEINGRIIFEGKVTKADYDLVDRIVQSTLGAVSLVKVQEFEYLPLIRMDVRIVEISKKASSQLGIKWDPLAGGPVVGVSTTSVNNKLFSLVSSQETRIPNAIGTSGVPVGDSNFYGYVGITSSLGSQIDLLAQTGDAHLLAVPKLVAKSGEEASFLSGGSFPVQVVSALGVPSIDLKEYGITLKIKPTVDDKQRINTEILASVSSLDFSVAINGSPGLLQRQVNTVVNVFANDTIVISGLASSQNSSSVSKVPFLGDLPLIGGLFRSTGKSDQQTELVILLTPHIVSPGDKFDRPLQEAGEAMTHEGFGNTNLNSALME